MIDDFAAQSPPEADGGAVLPPLARDRALALASTPEELTNLAAQAEAVRRLLKRSKRKLAEQNEVAVFRLKVLRKLGALLAETPKNRGTRRGTAAVTSSNRQAPTLTEMGISKRDSAKWQRLAAIPEGLFKEHCKKLAASGQPVTEAGFASLLGRFTEPKPLTLLGALRKLEAAIGAVRRRWPPGEEARDALAAALRAYAADVEKGGIEDDIREDVGMPEESDPRDGEEERWPR